MLVLNRKKEGSRIDSIKTHNIIWSPQLGTPEFTFFSAWVELPHKTPSRRRGEVSEIRSYCFILDRVGGISRLKPKSSVNDDNAEGETDGSKITVLSPIAGLQSRYPTAIAEEDPGCSTWISARAESTIGYRFNFCLNPALQMEIMSCTIDTILWLVSLFRTQDWYPLLVQTTVVRWPEADIWSSEADSYR